MSTMPRRDLRLWAKEELTSAIKRCQQELHDDPEETFDERCAVDREVARLISFLNGRKK